MKKFLNISSIVLAVLLLLMATFVYHKFSTQKNWSPSSFVKFIASFLMALSGLFLLIQTLILIKRDPS